MGGSGGQHGRLRARPRTLKLKRCQARSRASAALAVLLRSSVGRRRLEAPPRLRLKPCCRGPRGIPAAGIGLGARESFRLRKRNEFFSRLHRRNDRLRNLTARIQALGQARKVLRSFPRRSTRSWPHMVSAKCLLSTYRRELIAPNSKFFVTK